MSEQAEQPRRSSSDSRPSLRERQRQYTHDLLLSAGQELFVRNGYLATTVEDIAVRAGTTRATFYLHFSNRDALLLELTTIHNRELASHLDRLDAALVEGTLVHIRDWLEESYDFLVSWFRLTPYWDEAIVGQKRLALLGGNYLEQLVDMFPRYQKKMRARMQNKQGLKILLMFFTLERLFKWAPVPQIQLSRAESIDTIATLWFETLQA